MREALVIVDVLVTRQAAVHRLPKRVRKGHTDVRPPRVGPVLFMVSTSREVRLGWAEEAARVNLQTQSALEYREENFPEVRGSP